METIVISLGVILLAVLGIVVSNLIVIPLFGENFRNSLPILYILLFASAFSAINSFMENYFFVENKTMSLKPNFSWDEFAVNFGDLAMELIRQEQGNKKLYPIFTNLAKGS